MLYTEGTLRAEDNALRHVARTKVVDALRSIEIKTSQILNSLIGKITAQTEPNCATDQLLQFVLAHPQIQSETSIIERYTHAFPELELIVMATRQRIDTNARVRLERAFAPYQYARRFRFTKGVLPH